MLALELAVVVLLILLNGLLALAELAVVSSRRIRLKTMAGQGIRAAKTALDLLDNPGRFLSTVQTAITLIGVLAGAVSGATLGDRVAVGLAGMGVPKPYADPLGLGAVVVCITYLSVILGELVPKHLALSNPERFAVAVAPSMAAIARAAGPVVGAFDLSGRLVLRLLGVASGRPPGVTDEDVRAIITEARSAGVIEAQEHSMIAQVMRLADRPVRAVMTPRPMVDMIGLTEEPETIRDRLRASVHSRLPAYRGDPQEIVGIIQAKDLLNAYLSGGAVDPRDFVRPPVIIPDTIDVLDAIGKFKETPVHMALVYDEYGNFQGVVTMFDILAAIAGEFRTEEGPPRAKYTQRPDGSWLIDGDLSADELAELLGIRLPQSVGYETAAGFLLAAFGRLPEAGEDVVFQTWRFEVMDLDGRRIDKILAEPIPLAHRHM